MKTWKKVNLFCNINSFATYCICYAVLEKKSAQKEQVSSAASVSNNTRPLRGVTHPDHWETKRWRLSRALGGSLQKCRRRICVFSPLS